MSTPKAEGKEALRYRVGDDISIRAKGRERINQRGTDNLITEDYAPLEGQRRTTQELTLSPET